MEGAGDSDEVERIDGMRHCTWLFGTCCVDTNDCRGEGREVSEDVALGRRCDAVELDGTDESEDVPL
jgi:hypothetical protein